jgi:aryl-alcohol dehydrogenase-like predicted oxidoreductase
MREKNAVPPGIGLGTWQLGDDPYWPGQGHTDSLKVIDAALRAGITHFDTAQVYGNGRSEQLLGQRLKKQTGRLFIATKVFPCPPEQVEKKISLSLKRLFRAYIDLLYIHWPAGEKDLRPMMEVLEGERRKGRIRCIGVSNFSVPQMEKISDAGKIDACQTAHSLIWRTAEEEIIPWCGKKGIQVIAYSPLGQGVLAGRFSDGNIPADDPRSRLLPLHTGLRGELTRLLAVLHQEAGRAGLPPGKTALAWTLSKPFLHGAVIGARNRTQLEEAASARDTLPGNDALERLDEASSRFSRAMKDAGVRGDDNIFGHGRQHA